MRPRILWLVVSCLTALFLVITACGPATPTPPITQTTPSAPATPSTLATPATPTVPPTEKTQQEAVKPTLQIPKYGGVLTLARDSDTGRWEPVLERSGGMQVLTHEPLWEGDWSKGPAGGYGAKKASWTISNDVYDLKAGLVAESWKWTVDTAKNEGTIVYQIRKGIHYGLNPKSEASRLVNGREVTTDDVVFSLDRLVHHTNSYVYGASPELRPAVITKTGPQEVTVKVPIDAVVSALSRMGGNGRVVPPEVISKYGDMEDWKNTVGTGPFMVTERVPGSAILNVRNPNYWGKDPIGPGKGNQLPYVDAVRYLIIPDNSTQQAALRTGKLDHLPELSQEDASSIRRTVSAFSETESGNAGGGGIYVNTQRAPFTDIRVRQAMMLATDLQAINQSLYDGKGQINNFPWGYYVEYADLYLGLDDPDMPASVKELYTYNPEKAKQLLKEAGYPNGFKTSVLIVAGEADYFSIMKDMWAKAGIDLTLDVRESGAKTSLGRAGNYDITIGGWNPPGIFFTPPTLTTQDKRYGQVNDPVVNEAFSEIRKVAITDDRAAMRLAREHMKYLLGQVYAIPVPGQRKITFWWPWLKNYSGEYEVGYGQVSRMNWPKWVWLDQELKKSLGY